MNLVNMHGGLYGATDETGRVSEPGWSACGFETTRKSLAGRTWAELTQGLPAPGR